jgi:predicted small lipoprotein YifL
VKFSVVFLALMAAATIAATIAGCGASGPAPVGLEQPPPPTSTPAATRLYVDHNGTFYEYALPLTAHAKPLATLTEWPHLAIPPVIAADQYGNVALASSDELRLFHHPIVSFAPSLATLRLKLTPAITEMGIDGADLIDLEYDPNENLWLFNNLGAEISELRTPISKKSVAAVTIGFGAPGSKTAGFTTLIQGRFDVNAALYVYASNSVRGRLFKISFPYAKPPSSLGIDLGQADFVDTSQWPPAAPIAPDLLLGQYIGALHSPRPGSPPSPAVDVTAQFAQPFNPQQGLFPNEHTDTIAGALIADPYRYSYYTLDYDDGSLQVYDLPMRGGEKPKLSLPCLAGKDNCGAKPMHLFLAP